MHDEPLASAPHSEDPYGGARRSCTHAPTAHTSWTRPAQPGPFTYLRAKFVAIVQRFDIFGRSHVPMLARQIDFCAAGRVVFRRRIGPVKYDEPRTN
jgi:hypothetical protein